MCSDPDDEGHRSAGEIEFLFESPILTFGFDVVDVESAMAENGSVTLYGSEGTRTVSFMQLADSQDPDYYDPTIVFGDHSANRIAPISGEDLGEVLRVVIAMGGSGAVDNVTYAVPEPGALVLVTLSLLALPLGRNALPLGRMPALPTQRVRS